MNAPHILLLNVNTSKGMTERIHAAAATAATPGTRVVATQPSWGTPSVEGYYDGALSVVSALDRLHQLDRAPESGLDGPWDAVIWAGFGDQGREALQEFLDVPVITIAEAAAHLAMLVGRTFGIITTLSRSIPQIEDSLDLAGLSDRCVAVCATGLGVLEAADDAEVLDKITATGRGLLDAGAEVLCLGSAAMAGLAPAASAQLGVSVIDGVTAAITLAEACHRLGLATSKINAYATPAPKARIGWPITK